MLTQEQANELNLQQHVLEAAEIGYAKANADLQRYQDTLQAIKDSYSTFTPEQKELIAAQLPALAQRYNELKTEKENYTIKQYEAQQQIEYLNNLNAQQQATSTATKRRVNQPPTAVPEVIATPEVVASEPIIAETVVQNPDGTTTVNADVIQGTTEGQTITPLQGTGNGTPTIAPGVTPLQRWIPGTTKSDSGLYTWQPTTTAEIVQPSTRRRVIPVIPTVSGVVNGINTLPNKVNGAVQMAQATPNLLSNANKTLGAYNQATNWNGLKGLGSNIQGGVNLAKTIPGTLGATNKFLGGVNTYRGY